MARQQVKVSLTPQPVQPVAPIIDRFADPHAGQRLAQLAQSLSTLAPALAGYSDVLAKQHADRDNAAGEVLASELATNEKTIGSAVRKGQLNPVHSPWFQLGVQSKLGRVAGDKFGSYLAARVVSELADSTDLSAFDKLAAQARKDWLKDNVGDAATNLAFGHNFTTLADGHIAALRDEFARQAGTNLTKQAIELATAEATHTVDDGLQHGTSSALIAQSLSAQLAGLQRMGLDMGKVNTAVALGIANAAANHRSVTAFEDIARLVPTAGKLTLWDSPAAQDARQRGESLMTQTISAEATLHEQQKSQTEESVQARWATALATSRNPGALDPNQFLPELKAVGAASYIDDLRGVQSRAAAAKFDTDPLVATDLTYRIVNVSDRTDHDYVTPSTITSLITAGKIHYSQFPYWLNLLQQYHPGDLSIPGANGGKQPTDDDQYRQALSGLRTMFGRQVDIQDPSALTTSLKRAINNLSSHWAQYVSQHTGPVDPAEYQRRQEFLSAVVEQQAATFLSKFHAAMVDGVPEEDKPGTWQDTPKMNSAQAQRAVNEWSQGGAAKLSPSTLQFIRDNKVSPADAPNFIRIQALLNGITP